MIFGTKKPDLERLNFAFKNALHMKQRVYSLFIILFCGAAVMSAQTNLLTTNPLAEQIFLGNYDPADYAPSTASPAPPDLAIQLNNHISADSLRAYIIRLSQFGNRNSGSDTVSSLFGIGAARRWVAQKFTEFSAINQQRLIVSYFQFDQVICAAAQHRNIMAILPGSNPQSGIILVEGHIDSRCSGLCDINCIADGVEDNATGTALVIELARIMAPYQFENTIIFMLPIAEEQGLYGADAFASYALNKNIPLRAVLNNDVIGGIICGKTSSPPSCPGLNDVDSTSVRMFSSGSFNSKHKQLSRFIKLEYRENLLETVAVPMNIRIMSPEDRSGRGGDHIPFREKGFAAMRLTAANEHGDASNSTGYTDRQHTSDDILGIDTDNNGAVDSFFVDFNYLARNTVINANAIAMAAQNVALPADFTAVRSGNQLILKLLNTTIDTFTFRIALRSTTNDWDTVYTVTGNQATVPCNATGSLFASIAGVDTDGVESLFSGEKIVTTSATNDPENSVDQRNIRLLQNRPNPFDEATWISFWVQEVPVYRNASIEISDMQGKLITKIPVKLQAGMNEILYTHGYGGSGTFTYSLVIDQNTVDTRQMIFAN